MPDPDRIARLHAAHLYLCTPARPDLAEFLDEVLAGGVDIVALREKGLTARQELELCEVVGDAAARYGALWAVNDRADVAYCARPDALHLGQDDLPVAAARYLLGDGVLVGKSVHDPEQAASATLELGVDYLFAGPALPSANRPARPSAGLDLIRAMAASGTRRPWFADGGILDPDSLDEVVAAGARRVVVVRALTEAADPRSAAAALKQRLTAL